MLTFLSPDPLVRIAIFSSGVGCEETYISIGSPLDDDCATSLEAVAHRYRLACDAAHLDEETLIFSRIFMSDIENQNSILKSSNIFHMLAKGALSVVGQSPLVGGSVCLLSYHIGSSTNRLTKRLIVTEMLHGGNALLAHGEHYSLLYTAGTNSTEAPEAGQQAKEIFFCTAALLEQQQMSIARNMIRTWVFVRDIGNHYKIMVDMRREFFETIGLTAKTRYLASTGIEAYNSAASTLISLDSLSFGGIREEQIVRMEALGNMPPTISYGVTFERGLRLRFGDRSHIYISGTASVDASGTIMYPGDARQQMHCAIDNVESLLAAQHASLSDMVLAIVYVRDFHAVSLVRSVMEQRLGVRVPCIFSHAAICRPGWLIEIEGVAICNDKTQFKPMQ